MFAHLFRKATMLGAISPLRFPPVFKRHLTRLCRRSWLIPGRGLRELYFTARRQADRPRLPRD